MQYLVYLLEVIDHHHSSTSVQSHDPMGASCVICMPIITTYELIIALLSR